jgi:hypothetical protein
MVTIIAPEALDDWIQIGVSMRLLILRDRAIVTGLFMVVLHLNMDDPVVYSRRHFSIVPGQWLWERMRVHVSALNLGRPIPCFLFRFRRLLFLVSFP